MLEYELIEAKCPRSNNSEQGPSGQWAALEEVVNMRISTQDRGWSNITKEMPYWERGWCKEGIGVQPSSLNEVQ